jgi:hypothetical protein
MFSQEKNAVSKHPTLLPRKNAACRQLSNRFRLVLPSIPKTIPTLVLPFVSGGHELRRSTTPRNRQATKNAGAILRGVFASFNGALSVETCLIGP